MGHLILHTVDQRTEYFDLQDDAVVVGRASDCDLSVHDIMLSRRHCRIVPARDTGGDSWMVIDLTSRNGTFVGADRVEQQLLHDGDVILMGKTRVTFKTEPRRLPTEAVSRRPRVPVAVDPGETISGSIVVLNDVKPGPVARTPRRRMPTPKPRPRDPDSFEDDDLYSMLEQIASSSWDSIYAVNARPLNGVTRERPRPMLDPGSSGLDRLLSSSVCLEPVVGRTERLRVSLSLQVGTEAEAFDPVETTSIEEVFSPQDSSDSIRTDKPASVRPIRRRAWRLTTWIQNFGRYRISTAAVAALIVLMPA